MKKKLVGGQAVIEGVMMRSGNKVATAIRKDGKILVKKERINFLGDKAPWSKIPLVRGVINMVEFLIVGVRTLEYSAQQAAGEEEKFSKAAMAATIAFSLGFGILLFVLLPYFLTNMIGLREQQHPAWFNLIDGAIKVGILIAYIALIGLIKDIRTVFQYHGAEHKAVACHEAGKELTAKNCRSYSTKHRRCGTSFIMFVILVGVVLFAFIPLIATTIWPGITVMPKIPRYIIFFGARIMLLPLVAGIAYEFLRLSARFEHNAIVRLVVYPGLFVQKLTTREPTSKQLEVAIAAIKSAV
jgi:uncharacterized protein YqhQ